MSNAVVAIVAKNHNIPPARISTQLKSMESLFSYVFPGTRHIYIQIIFRDSSLENL